MWLRFLAGVGVVTLIGLGISALLLCAIGLDRFVRKHHTR